MADRLRLSVSPHIHSGRSTAKIMRDVILALLPTTAAGVWIFGWRALLVVAVSVAAAIGFEALFNLLIKKEQTIGDCSAALTGLLLALNLPANIPLWQCAAGSAFAIVIVKCIFGGLGCNVVNPAITARVFMLVAFGSLAIPTFPAADTVSSATPLVLLESGGELPSLMDLFLGNRGGAIGEVCVAALLAGFLYLLARRVITWHISVAFLGSLFLLTWFGQSFDAVRALSATISGSAVIGAVFMATDYVTSPATWRGKLVYGAVCGILTFLIRSFSVYPEGVSFAILLGNILTPYIDMLTAHKVFGGKKV